MKPKAPRCLRDLEVKFRHDGPSPCGLRGEHGGRVDHGGRAHHQTHVAPVHRLVETMLRLMVSQSFDLLDTIKLFFQLESISFRYFEK